MSYNRYDGEGYYSRDKVYDRRPQKGRSVKIIIVLSVSLALSVGIVIGVVFSLVRQAPSVVSGNSSSSNSSPGNVPQQNTTHFWKTNGVQGGMVVHGPGVISGDLDVNGITVHQGIADEGTVIILEDNVAYTLSGPNAGTIYTPENWQPTLADLQAKAQQLVNDQHTSHNACQGGCTNSYVATFQNGQETSAGVQNPT